MKRVTLNSGREVFECHNGHEHKTSKAAAECEKYWRSADGKKWKSVARRDARNRQLAGIVQGGGLPTPGQPMKKKGKTRPPVYSGAAKPPPPSRRKGKPAKQFRAGDITVNAIGYHRNGVGGCPFYVVDFQEGDRHYMAVVFPNSDIHGNDSWAFDRSVNPLTAVFNFDSLAEGEIDDCYRGEYFDRALREAIEK